MHLPKNAIKDFLFALLYCICFYLLNLFLHQRDMVHVLPNSEDISRWDVGWYKNVVDNGYRFSSTGVANSAFYPLFPWIWKLSHLGPWGISFLNIVFFAVGFAIFNRIYTLDAKEKFIFLSIPSLYFVFIPYTEALFFLLGCMALWAIERNNRPVIWISLILLSLSRPVALILIPAALIAELIINDRGKWLWSLWHGFINYVAPLALGTLFFIWYQHHETGVWFAFFKQEKYWGHEIIGVRLPFSSMYGYKLLWIDALAMFLGFISLILLIKWGVQWLAKNKFNNNRLLVLSLLYIVALLCTTILFSPMWVINTTNVYDIHRYVFASPFFWVFLYHFVVKANYKPAMYLWILLLSNAFWLLFASYDHIMHTVYYNFCTLLIMLYMLHADKRLTWPVLAMAAINVFIQVQMFQFFLSGVYHG